MKYFLLGLLFTLTSNTYANIQISPAYDIQGLKTKNHHLIISKKFLEKEFIFHVSTMLSNPVALGNSLYSKIVIFRLSGDDIIMLESEKGKNRSDSLKTYSLLARFPIIRKGSQIKFDFNEGMKRIFVAGSLAGSSDYSQEDEIVEIADSYVNNLKTDKDTISVDQVVFVNASSINKSAQSVRLRYTLSPYEKNLNFKPKPFHENREVGFFETKISYNPHTTDPHTNILKIDHNQTKTFLISKSTPPELIEAVKDGVNYWNNVFGKKIFKTALQKDDQEIYDINTNTIQWVNFKDGDGAYVDLKADPITGEILQQNVFITSAYLEQTQDLFKSGTDVMFKIKGFKNIPASEHKDFAKFSMELVQKDNLSKEQILEAKKDRIRFVVAHEVGHSLGLRHNFAASLNSNVSVEKQTELYKQYVETFQLPGDFIPSSSVMEYPGFIDMLLLGRLIKQGKTLPYDKKAISWAYNDKNLDELKDMHFCTDDHVYEFYDCERRDSTTKPIEYRFKNFKDTISSSAYSYLYQYVEFNKKKAHEKEGASIELSPGDHAEHISNKLHYILDIYSENAKMLKTRTHLEDNFINEDELKKQDIQIKKQAMNINKFYTYILELLENSSLSQKWTQDYNQLKEMTLANSYQQLSDELKIDADSKAKHYFKKLEERLQEEVIRITSSIFSNSVNEGIEIENFEKFAARFAKLVILKKSTSNLILLKNSSGNSVTINKFHYPLKVRKHAKQLLSASKTIKGYNDALTPDKARIKSLYQKELDVFKSLEDEGFVIPRSLKPYIDKQKGLF